MLACRPFARCHAHINLTLVVEVWQSNYRFGGSCTPVRRLRPRRRGRLEATKDCEVQAERLTSKARWTVTVADTTPIQFLAKCCGWPFTRKYSFGLLLRRAMLPF